MRISDWSSDVCSSDLYTAERIVIATGGRAIRPGIEGAEHGITSNEAFHLKTLPKRILVYGGGYIAVEFAGIFNGLGAEVTEEIGRASGRERVGPSVLIAAVAVSSKQKTYK